MIREKPRGFLYGTLGKKSRTRTDKKNFGCVCPSILGKSADGESAAASCIKLKLKLLKMTSIQLVQRKDAVQAKINALLNEAEQVHREVTPEEVAQMRDWKKEVKTYEQKIEDAIFIEEEKRSRKQQEAAPVILKNPEKGEQRTKAQLAKEFSFRKIIADKISGRNIEGLEAEMWQEGEKEAREAGKVIEGVALPGFLMGSAKGAAEKRADLTVADATYAGNVVQNTIGEVVEYLYPRTVLRDLGATFIGGLRDGFDLINQDAAGSATWEGEVDANAETNPTVAKTTVRPKRLGAYTVFSKQLVNQAVLDVEAWVRNDLGVAVGQALEVAAINGSGSAPIPRGVLNISGIGDVAGGTNGAVPTWANLVELETDINSANAPMGSRAYLTTPGINGLLKTVKKDAGSGIFVNENGMVNGYPMLFTSNVPSNLEKGSSGTVCHAIIFGNWEELYLLQWGGIDLVVNPYSLDTTSQVRVTINSWWDIAVRHKESFSAMQDALLS